MSTLSSASTDQAVWDSFDDNASFEEDQSATKAAAFVTACRILLRRRPQSTSVDGTTVSFDGGAIEKELMRAQKWLAANRSNAAGGVRYLDFSGVRD